MPDDFDKVWGTPFWTTGPPIGDNHPTIINQQPLPGFLNNIGGWAPSTGGGDANPNNIPDTYYEACDY